MSQPLTAVGIDSPAGVFTDLLHAIDDLDWARVRDALADEVVVDYTSLFGGEVETVEAGALVERWRGLLPGFDATQHLTGPVLVRPTDDGTVAAVATHVRAYHLLRVASAGSVWMVAGHYRASARRFGAAEPETGRWRISALTLRTFYEDGDRSLVETASARAATAPRLGPNGA